MHFVKAKGILNGRSGFLGMNVYRGCAHGCIYCDSRSACYRFSHAFEDIEVKENAPQLLERELAGRKKKCMIGTGSMSDPYLPCETDLRLTRRCLQVIRNHGFGATVLTKSDRILEDLDLLEEIHRKTRCVVQITLTASDDRLAKKTEPGVCPTSRRIEVLRIMKDRGIPTVVWMTPILPFITDTSENIEALLQACAETGVKGIMCFNMGMTLREGCREYYYAALDRLFPGMKENYIRTYGNSYELISPDNEALMAFFHRFCQANDILHTPQEVFRFLGEFPQPYEQLSLF